MRLLLVEDEEMLSKMLAKGLRKRGYAVDAVYDGEQALFEYSVNEYDLIILDLNLPKVDGLEVLRQIRKKDYSIKVLILSARSEIEDRVAGLDLGANDYLSKPFDFAELDARVRGLLRRSFVQAPAEYAVGALRIDTSAKAVFFHDAELELTKKEYGILEYLIQHKNAVISAETLYEHVWDNTADPFSNVLQYHIHMLKKKMEKAGCADMLQNIRGQGYILMEEKHEA